MSQHAILAPSGSGRWLRCLGSVAADQRVTHRAPKGEPYAARSAGTAAHWLLEQSILEADSQLRPLESWAKSGLLVDHDGNVRHFQSSKAARNAKRPDERYVYVGKPMMRGLEHGWRYVNDLIWRGWDVAPEVKVEIRAPYCYGTVDVLATRDSEVKIVGDYKNGWYFVEVERNTQLMLYALGAFKHIGQGISDAEVAIIQPNAPDVPPVRTWVAPAAELESLKWRLERVVGTWEALWSEAKGLSVSEVLQLFERHGQLVRFYEHQACEWCPHQQVCPVGTSEERHFPEEHDL